MYFPKAILKITITSAILLTIQSFGCWASGASTQMQGQVDSMKEQLIAQRDKEIDERTNYTQEKIQNINEAVELQVAGVPRFYYNGWGYPYPNQDYERTVAYMRVDTQKEINKINKDLMAITKTINATYQEKLNAIDSSYVNTSTQAKAGTGDIQLSPVGSNMYVKNYVNYAVDPPKPVGLKARQKSLAYKTSKRSVQKDIKP